MKIRLQKFLAERGIGSRRGVEDLIKAGKIKVNARTAGLGMKVDESDKVEIAGKRFDFYQEKKIYIMFNKPQGVLSTCEKSREQGKTVLDYVRVRERIYPIGRLDKDSEGLLVLTNDGELALRLTHPRYEHEKEYYVRVGRPRISRIDSNISNTNTGGQADFKYFARKLEKGVDIGGYVTRSSTVKILTNSSFLVTLKEGKKRQIRRMCQAVGLEVKELKRVRIGKLELGDLKAGKWRYLKASEVESLLI